REPILIDTGIGVPEYVPLLERYMTERGWTRPSRVVLTHHHKDHLGGVKDLRTRFPGLAVAKRTHTTDELEGVATIDEGQIIEGDGFTLVPIHTPGHASDHLCYYLPEEKALFTGDVVLSGSTSVIPSGDGDLLDYMNSLKRLQGFDVRRIYSAHGPVIEDGPGRIAEYIAHRLLRERQILDVLDGGTDTIPAMVKIIYKDVPEKLHHMAGQSVESHLKKLAREGRVSETTVRDAPSRWRLV
ncbi:MAG TPA: MBL fold metallo-hydrolase, partial [Terriglobales bacterium]|nr:MBL fold metallo-hydrolase [Terriglobales bacterium]